MHTAEWRVRFPHLEVYRIRQFCEFGLQTSHVCAVIFVGYGVFLSNENSQYSNKISNFAQLPFWQFEFGQKFEPRIRIHA